MSIPLQRFSHLSLVMPTTRAQSLSSRMAEDRDSSSRENENLDESSDDDDTTESPTIPGPSQLQYDVRRFDVDHCRQVQPNGYYAFQVAETTPFSVRIGSPLSRWSTPECFCRDTTDLEPLSDDEYAHLLEALHQIRNSASAGQLRSIYDLVQENNSDKACRHVYWLKDQIAGQTLEDQEKGDLYTMLSNIGLEALAQEKNWKLHSNDGNIPEATANQGKSAAVNREEEIRDLIAALSSSVRPEILDQLHRPLVEADVLVPYDIEATLARALLFSDACFEFFESAIPLNYRAVKAFDKLREEAKKHLALLDDYIASASRRDTITTHDVVMTAQALKDIVASVEREYESRSHAVGPLARREAAKVLVFILNAVVLRDNDVYASLRATQIPIPQRAMERNLYQLLIGSASRHEDLFILDVLDTFPDGATDLVDELDFIYSRIASRTSPDGYLTRLRRIADQARGRDFRGISPRPSSKRPSEAPEARSSGKRQMK